METAIDASRRALDETALLQGQIDTVSAVISDRDGFVSRLRYAESPSDAGRLHDEPQDIDHLLALWVRRVSVERSLLEARRAI